MELKEMIKVMQHFDNGGEVEYSNRESNIWNRASAPVWDWTKFNYRIKEQKQKVAIEKWLCLDNQGNHIIVETSNIDGYRYLEKVKLIESYEIEL